MKTSFSCMDVIFLSYKSKNYGVSFDINVLKIYIF